MKIIDRPSDQAKPAVDLTGAYSNRLDLTKALVTAVEGLRQAKEGRGRKPVSVRSAPNSDRPRRVTDRLSDSDLRALLRDVEQGTPKWQVAEKYRISESSVKRLVRKAHPSRA